MSIPLLMPSTITRAPLVDQHGVLTGEAKRWLTESPKNHALKVQNRFSDTRAARLKQKASNFAEGVLWKETDTGVTYISDGVNWEPHAGTITVTQDSLPTNLTAADAGVLVNVSDYAHVLRWNGTGFEFADAGSGYTQAFLINPGTGWLLCDGTANVLTLLGDGTLDNSVTLPNTPGTYYRQ